MCCSAPRLHDDVHRLRLEHIRLSPLESGVGVTVVIAYDARRLSMLDGVCATWGGHISAAVYLVGGLSFLTPAPRRLAATSLLLCIQYTIFCCLLNMTQA